MKLFKDDETHAALAKDREALCSISDKLVTRMGSRAIDTLIENVDELIWDNLTEEANAVIQKLMEEHPDSVIIDVVDFVEFQNSVVIHQAGWLDTEIGLDVHDTIESVRVYKGTFYIENLKDGRQQLIIENQCWTTPETSLLEMELELYGFYQLMQN